MKQYREFSVQARTLQMGCKWVFHMDNGPKHNAKLVIKWLKDKENVLERPSQGTEKVCGLSWKDVAHVGPPNPTWLHQLWRSEMLPVSISQKCCFREMLIEEVAGKDAVYIKAWTYMTTMQWWPISIQKTPKHFKTRQPVL